MTDNNTSNTKNNLIEFPCDFLVKVIGNNDAAFKTTVHNILHKHFPDVNEQQISQRDSKTNNYCALTISVHATYQQQLDALYTELSQHPEIIMAL
jgi:uncharacterized protein